MRSKYLILKMFCLFSIIGIKAQTGYYFYVQLKDKNNTPYTLSNPSAYLSQRALDRRVFFNVGIDSTDLPVNQSYISQIQATNVEVHNVTKWLNGVTIYTTDSSKITDVQNLSCVKFTQYTGKTNSSGSLISRKKLEKQAETYDYGYAATQINQMNGAILHNDGYRGQGMQIAVIDAGFLNVNTNVGFDSLRNEGRLLGTKDFVNPQSNIYTENFHGAYVLSTMAGNIPNSFLGTAPKASYWLLRSEAANTENLCEPDFWVSAIEFADSAGVDVSTTSLGYTEFDIASMNYTYADMDGKTARASIAATMAADKGIMVLNSAGNDAAKTWHYIGVPADADKIITVGAVGSDGSSCSFSSYGPTSDGRLKPELSASGCNAALISSSGTVTYGGGTSFATPILAGMTACFLQAAKDKKPSLSLSQIRDMMYRSANLYVAPSYQAGYGIPNFTTAYNELLSLATLSPVIDNIKIIMNPIDKTLSIEIGETISSKDISVKLYNSIGSLVKSEVFISENFSISTQTLQSGIYILNLSFNGKIVNKKILI